MKNVLLSDRLSAVAGLIKSSDCVCDIGTDHGFVPIYLINSGACLRAIAMDINEGPLERAKEHIRENGLEDVIETRLSNGMEKLTAGEADAIICAGMGGLLMKRILEDGKPREKGIKQMVLQPQSDLRSFREYLRKENFIITEEVEIFEDGKYYVAILVKVEEKDSSFGTGATKDKAVTVEGLDSVTDRGFCGTLYEEVQRKMDLEPDTAIRICDRFGPSLLLKKDETLRSYLEHEKKVCEGILLKLSENEHTERIHDIMSKMNDITIALNMYS